MGALKALKTLNLGFNDFSQGNIDIFAHMSSLEAVDLSSCELSTLPARLVSNVTCRRIDFKSILRVTIL